MENLAIGVPYLSEAETGSWQVGMAWPAPLPPAPGYTGLHILFLFLPNIFFLFFSPHPARLVRFRKGPRVGEFSSEGSSLRGLSRTRLVLNGTQASLTGGTWVQERRVLRWGEGHKYCQWGRH